MKKRLSTVLTLLVMGILFIGILPAMDTKSTTLNVKGMTCGDCVDKVSNALKAVDGISAVSVDHSTGKALVTYDADLVSMDMMKSAVKTAGFKVGKKSWFSKKKQSANCGSGSCCTSKGGSSI